MSNEKQTHAITCSLTGITVAAVTVIKVAGHIPYLSQWKHTQATHPIFSLSPTELLNFSKSLWNHFCSLSIEEAADSEKTEKQETLLRICSLAMLHQLADVDQSIPWLPSIQDVSTNWNSLLQLSYWKVNLESVRFRFPDLRITKNNKGIDLTAYMEDCWSVKKEYDGKKKELHEEEQRRAAEDALISIRGEIAGKAPRSKKLLWKWFCSHVATRYSKDLDGWMLELWEAETLQELEEFTLADIDLFEEITLCEVPTGSSISHAFLERLSNKRKTLESKFTAFEILVPELIEEQKAAGTIAAEEPILSSFPNKVQFLIAHAKWKLAHTDMNKHRDAEIARQEKRTVTPTHVPDITEFLSVRSDETELDDGSDLVSIHRDSITGEIEE